MNRFAVVAAAAVLALLSGNAARGNEPQSPAIETFLLEGRLGDGERMLLEKLQQRPDDDEVRMSLGVTRALLAVENLGQNLYRHGSRPRGWFALGMFGGGAPPLLRMPVPNNPDPEPIDYDRFREIIAEFLARLEKAEATLATVEDSPAKLPLKFGQIRLDLDSDGQGEPGEELWKVYAAVNPRSRQLPASAVREFTIVVDQADVHWLRGYCHLLSAICETVLAHDSSELFNHSAAMVFPKVISPVKSIPSPKGDFIQGILDEVAAVHLASFPVQHPERSVKAHRHLTQVIEQSRLMWEATEAETDNDREWIPGPHQTGVVPGVRITKEMVEGWKEFLDEAELVLQGKKLIPYWRGKNPKLGVNLKRAFHEPRKLDLVLWVNGVAAVPYLEEGDVTKPDVWARFNRIFRGQFIGFAVWIN